MSPFGIPNDLHRRIIKLETAVRGSDDRMVRLFSIEGPNGLPRDEAIVFLRECGHDVRDEDFNIIRVVIGAKDGRPVDLPLRDITARCSR